MSCKYRGNQLGRGKRLGGGEREEREGGGHGGICSKYIIHLLEDGLT